MAKKPRAEKRTQREAVTQDEAGSRFCGWPMDLVKVANGVGRRGRT